jgi:hypothetical protein
MSIENLLERQAVALESIAESLKGLSGLSATIDRVRVGEVSQTTAKVETSPAVPEKKKAEAEAKKDEPKGPTVDDVKKALAGYVAKAKELGIDEAAAKEQAKAIVKDVGGVDGVSKLDPSKFAAVIAKAGEGPKKPASVAEKKDEPEYPSEDKVRDALRELSKVVGRDGAKKLAHEVGGAEGVVDIPPEKRQAVIDAANEKAKVASAEEDF